MKYEGEAKSPKSKEGMEFVVEVIKSEVAEEMCKTGTVVTRGYLIKKDEEKDEAHNCVTVQFYDESGDSNEDVKAIVTMPKLVRATGSYGSILVVAQPKKSGCVLEVTHEEYGHKVFGCYIDKDGKFVGWKDMTDSMVPELASLRRDAPCAELSPLSCHNSPFVGKERVLH